MDDPIACKNVHYAIKSAEWIDRELPIIDVELFVEARIP